MKRTGLILCLVAAIAAGGLGLFHYFTRPKPVPWLLVVTEPMEGGSGFTRGYDNEADCKKDLQHWLGEAAWFKSMGREKDAPQARCIDRRP